MQALEQLDVCSKVYTRLKWHKAETLERAERGKKRMHEHVQSVHMEVRPSQRKACQGNKDTETQYSKSSTYELSS